MLPLFSSHVLDVGGSRGREFRAAGFEERSCCDELLLVVVVGGGGGCSHAIECALVSANVGGII